MTTTAVRRSVALCALAVVAIVLIVLLIGGGGSYTLQADFTNASQLVKGNLVQVAGAKVGTVTKIQLAPNGEARVTMKIDEDGYSPVRRGTRFVVRASSLSGVANRYVDLQMPPGDASTTGTYADNTVVPASETTSAVDLDQLFNTFGPKEQKALQNLIKGSAKQFKNTGETARVGFQYLNPSIAASTRLFEELARDTPKLRRYIVRSSNLVGDLATRRNDLTGLVNNLSRMSAAIARPPNALQRSVEELPPFMRRANTTFVNLRGTLDHLDPLVAESKPVAKKLRPFLAALRPFARDSVPTVRDLSALIRRPGSSNDLIEVMHGAPPLAKITVGNVFRNGKQREGAFPASTKALAGGTPELAYARPFAVDLTGWFDDFGHSGVYDANGGASRVQLILSALSLQQNGSLLSIPPALRKQFYDKTVTTQQYDKCPGAAARPSDGSNPWKPTADYPCDPSQIPPGK